MSRRQQTLKVQLPYRPSRTALDLLVDSTGIKFIGEGECKRKKHGAEYRRQWRKVHLAIDARTMEVRAIEVTDNGVGDASMLPELLAQIPADETIDSVSWGWRLRHQGLPWGHRTTSGACRDSAAQERQVVEGITHR